MKVSGQLPVPSASPTCKNPGTTWRLGRLQSRSGQFEVENKSVARAGLETRIIQPIAYLLHRRRLFGFLVASTYPENGSSRILRSDGTNQSGQTMSYLSRSCQILCHMLNSWLEQSYGCVEPVRTSLWTHCRRRTQKATFGLPCKLSGSLSCKLRSIG